MNKQNYIQIILAVFILSFSFTATADASEKYAETTQSECKVCHIDPLGGGELTQVGEGYYLSISPVTEQTPSTQKSIWRIVRIIAGYIHIVTAFMWFGTILYVHLVLKPAYASKGLPGGEVKVGLASMTIMAMTGTILTYYKVPSFGLLLSSQFGILLLTKILIFSAMVFSALFVVLVIGPKLKKKVAISPSKSGALTLAELANFDGKSGRSAYFAYKGKIYDATRSKLWRGGNHMKRHQAGVDLTDILSQAPHGEEKILSLPEIGPLSMHEEKPHSEVYKKVFYFMAYMNLGFVFIISLILALWRWY